MINRTDLQKCRYYFLDLPLWSCGMRSPSVERRLCRISDVEVAAAREGFKELCARLGITPTAPEIESVIGKSLLVRIVRESDAYTSLRMSRRFLHRYFEVEGIENLESAARKNRPVIILSGHTGSFFIPSIAFSHMGFNVYTLVRSVDRSPVTPHLTRIYQALNYRLTQRRFSASYIFTDFSGRIDRSIDLALQTDGILWAAIDIPGTLYPHKHMPVIFLGREASLPSGLIQRALKKKAIFLTAWNTVAAQADGNFIRKLSIDRPIDETAEAKTVLQVYADRLSSLIAKQPWQWLGLQIINQYNINRTKEDG